MVRSLNAGDSLHVTDLENLNLVLGCRENMGVVHLKQDDFRVEAELQDRLILLHVVEYQLPLALDALPIGNASGLAGPPERIGRQSAAGNGAC